MIRFTKGIAAIALVLFSFAPAWSLTPDEKCIAGRAKAKGKFELCVQNWMKKNDSATLVPQSFKVEKCRIKYDARYNKLMSKLPGTDCGAARFIDNGLTITDNLTGLVWEKKTNEDNTPNASDRHDADNNYTWSTSDGDDTDEDGTTYTDFLDDLNSNSFAGANGWRLPTFAELQTILRPEPFGACTALPCIPAIFGDTEANFTWTSSTPQFNTARAWYVDFFDGQTANFVKTVGFPVRAVRGGF